MSKENVRSFTDICPFCKQRVYQEFTKSDLEAGISTGQLRFFHCGQTFGRHLDDNRKAEIAIELAKIGVTTE